MHYSPQQAIPSSQKTTQQIIFSKTVRYLIQDAFKVSMPSYEVLEWRNRNLGCTLVSVTSFGYLLLRHLYLKDACMRCLTITCSDEHQQYSSITLTTIYNVVYNFVFWYCYLFIEYKSIPPHSYESFYVTPWNKLCHHMPYNWKIWRRNKLDKFKVDDTSILFCQY